MNTIGHVVSGLNLVDLVCLLLVVGAVVSGLKRRSVLVALGSAVGTAATLWLLAGALTVWGPPALVTAVADSTLLQTFPPATAAFHQLQHLVNGARGWATALS